MHPEFYRRLNNVTGCKIIEMYANASNNQEQKSAGLLPVVDKPVDRGRWKITQARRERPWGK